MDFEIKRCTKRCAATDREFRPGETFYSVLVDAGTEIQRLDYASDAWCGPPENCIGWWKSVLPDLDARKVHWAPNDVMLDYFLQLEDRPDSGEMRYVLTLLMIRRRIFRLEETKEHDDGSESLVVFCPRNETEYDVPVVMPDRQTAHRIQDELARLLFSHAA
ncbi:MAG: hypothetical protein R3E01_06070 [Pirellulaceae bacterium]